MTTYTLNYAHCSASLHYYDMMIVKADSEGAARLICRQRLIADGKKNGYNIYGCHKW